MKFNIIALALVASAFSLSSCERDEPEMKKTEALPLAGEWFVKYEVETSPGVFEDIYHVGYSTLVTSNTAANTKNEIMVSDEGNFWNYKVKANADADNRTFSANQSVSYALDKGAPYDIKVNITDGKVIKDGGRSASGVTTDSIMFNVEFEDDPGTIYRASGHKRTGFLEDEH
jgi:hypothetical protein